MKKFFALGLFAFLMVQYGFSQVFTGGSLFYQHTGSKIGNSSTDSNIIEVSPFLGYRFGKTDVGITVFYQKEIMSNENISNIGIGVFGDYNFISVDKFSILGKINLQYYNSTITGDDTISTSTYPYIIPYNTEQNLNNIGVSISPIVEYKLLDYLTLYTSIGRVSFNHSWGEYKIESSYNSLNQTDDISSNNFGISFSTGITLGFYVVF